MTEPPVSPQTPSSPPPGATPGGPPPAKSTPWGKIILFGCLGLLVLGIVVAVIGGGAAYFLKNREEPAVVESEPGTGILPSEPSDPEVAEGAEAYEGTLQSGDAVAPDGSWYDAYPLTVAQGSAYVITMRSADFDTYLTVVSPSGATYSDDDSGGGTDSRLDVTIDEPGTWNVWANTLRTGDTGNYTLTIVRTP
jgi:hypothetical protein